MKIPKINKSSTYLKKNIETYTSKAAGSNLSEIQAWIDDEPSIEKFHLNVKKRNKRFIPYFLQKQVN